MLYSVFNDRFQETLPPLCSPPENFGGLNVDRVRLSVSAPVSLFPHCRPFSCFLRKALVGSSGLEPPTSRLSGARSNLLSYEPIPRSSSFFVPLGGDDGIRTHDPLLAGQVLSQLSYTPI